MKRGIEGLRGEVAEDYLYDFINSHKGLSIYGLAKRLNWSTGKVYHIVQKLEEAGLVRSERVEEGGRLTRKVYSAHWTELLPEDVKSDLLARKKEIVSNKAPAGRHKTVVIQV